MGVSARAQSDRVVITPEPGFAITWDGNNGTFSSQLAGAAAPANAALASGGATALGSTEFGRGVHLISQVNDGLYGNSKSWIADFIAGDADPFVGVAFGKSVAISSIAWGRDNGNVPEDCCGGTLLDRSAGIYTLQITRVAAPAGDTAETGDAATGWRSIGTVEYLGGAESAAFTAALRHEFKVAAGGAPVAATGLRLKVSDPNICIDELEVNPPADTRPVPADVMTINPAAGVEIAWDANNGLSSTTDSPARAQKNTASASSGATPFGSTEFGAGVHFIANVNDGLYGNSKSWISNFAIPDPNPFVGVDFGKCIELRTLAWSRDNGDVAGDCCGGTLTDRALGTYTIQITALSGANRDTPETGDALSGWMTLGTVEYKRDISQYFTAALRHRFDIRGTVSPVLASALRIKVSNPNMAIDEIEVNSNLALERKSIEVASAAGFSIAWDGNNGGFSTAADPAPAPDNRALASKGTTPFGSTEFGGGGIHVIANVNDGLYGNSKSWIPDFVGGDAAPFIGLNFGGSVAIGTIAWSRDNGNVAGDCCGGNLRDRSLGTYTLQITRVASPDGTTAETGDAATGWVNVGTIRYAGDSAPDFVSALRHRFEVATAAGGAITATGLRLKAPDANTCIDEIEVNGPASDPPPAAPPSPILLASSEGFTLSHDGNQGEFSTDQSPAPAPDNRGLATQGSTAFGSTEFDAGGSHLIANINDGLYGNSKSWISNFTIPDPTPFVGLNFGGTVNLRNLAWSRDNGDVAGDCCGGTLRDRAHGTYTVQITRVANPGTTTADTQNASTGWLTVGTVTYTPPDQTGGFVAALRHRFELTTSAGAPVPATGLRLLAPDAGTCIDELEVNTADIPVPPIQIAREADNLVVTWTGEGRLQTSTDLRTWTSCFATEPRRFVTRIQPGGKRYFRLVR